MPKNFKRVYMHYERLEEYKCGMWRIVHGEQRAKNIELAAQLMRDIPAFSRAMLRAVEEWGNSCSFNLTSEESNRLAWLGHAGCCLGVGSPEENTRAGWHSLNQSEQDAANEAAQKVLEHWESLAALHQPQLSIQWIEYA